MPGESVTLFSHLHHFDFILFHHLDFVVFSVMDFNKSCDHCRRIKRTYKRLLASNSCQNCMAKNIHCIYSLSAQGRQNDLLSLRGEIGSRTVRLDYSTPGRPSSPVIEAIDPLTELHDD